MTPCPQSPKGLPCLFGPHKTGQRVYLACLTCGRVWSAKHDFGRG